MRRTTSGGTRIRTSAAVAAVTAALALPGAALAGSPSDDQYGSQLTQITVGSQASAGEPATTPVTGEAGGSLPFTGLDIVALVAVAAGLGVGGFALRRRLSTSEPSSTS